ncbi:helix-turn-helix transcriptional regulator [Desulfovibrio gilichinskyi]|uniref:Poly-beta-hydroxybutyrate-responsive repressor n=1 Tax=Desulfovibrio gilichinskyi TaxID=1519643 RepID=A0A1X7CU41_9BACT|nr:helix-turn-helix transcriptional regulator [Desulfovibrio gilichinskyi]SMF03220.1 poly-beta-hydroxybutyrate-responsive repressor [Desulfovibrio gilichinskyi]
MSKKVGGEKPQRYVQPSLLMALKSGSSYGYQLIQTIGEYGFMREDVPPGMIYRHLRQMDEEGVVESKWDSQGDGPAKRIYSITAEGLEILEAWILHMERQRNALDSFIQRYKGQ